MQLKVVTDISTEPVTIAIARNYIKHTDETETAEIALITSMVKSARQLLEKFMGLTFAEKTLHCFFDPEDLDDNKRVTIPAVPVIAISKVYSITNEGAETELTLNTGYYKFGMTQIEVYFPDIVLLGIDYNTILHYRVEFTAGYGHEDTEVLPEPIKMLILKQVAEWYENRENWIPVLSSEVKMIAEQYVNDTWLVG